MREVSNECETEGENMLNLSPSQLTLTAPSSEGAS